MVKIIKAEFDIFALRKTQRVNGWGYKRAVSEPGQRHSNKVSEADQDERQYLSETKDDQTYGERVDDRLETGYRG